MNSAIVALSSLNWNLFMARKMIDPLDIVKNVVDSPHTMSSHFALFYRCICLQNRSNSNTIEFIFLYGKRRVFSRGILSGKKKKLNVSAIAVNHTLHKEKHLTHLI